MDPSSSKIYFFPGYRHAKSWFQLFPPDNLTMKVVKFSIPLYVRFEHENMIFFLNIYNSKIDQVNYPPISETKLSKSRSVFYFLI